MAATAGCWQWRSAPRRCWRAHVDQEWSLGMALRPTILAWRRLRLVSAIVAVAPLAACETGPKLPLLSPIEQAREYGYSETQRGPDSYEVTYLAPSQRSTRFQPE